MGFLSTITTESGEQVVSILLQRSVIFFFFSDPGDDSDHMETSPNKTLNLSTSVSTKISLQ